MQVTIAAAVLAFILYIYFKRLDAAYGEVNINKIKHSAEDGNEKSIVICVHLEKIDKFKAAIKFVVDLAAVSTTICAVSAFWIAEVSSKGMMPPYDHRIYIGLIIVAVVLSIVLLLFGSLVSEKAGSKRSEDIVCSSIGFVSILSAILSPIMFISMGISGLIGKLMGIDTEEVDNVTEEEIRLLVDAGEGNGAIDENEKEMINNIFEFNNTIVGDIATHRTDIVAVSLSSTLEDIIEVINGEKFSRIPVYDENIDDIIGFFRVRDLLKFYTDGSNGKNFKFNDIILEPYFVPFSKKTDELFEDMQKNKVQMAIVIDEYGGTEGIVTMEDLIEEIMGNIFDEYDVDEEEIRQIDENTFLIKGVTEIDDVEEVLDISFEDSEDYDTLGGFLIGQLGRIPDDEERPKVVVGTTIFKVEKIIDKRIELIKVHKTLEIKAEEVVTEA